MSERELRNTLRLLTFSMKARNCADGTIEQYTIATRQFYAWLEEKGKADLFPYDVDRELCREWMAHLFEKGLAPATVRSRHNALTILYKELVEDGELDVSPMAGVRPPKLPETRKDVVPAEDMARVLTALDRERAWRNAAIISLFYDTGVRATELAGIRVEDIDEEEMVIELPKTKNREIRYVPYSYQTARRLDRWQRHRKDPGAPWLFTGLRGRDAGKKLTRSGLLKMVKTTFERFGIPNISPHDLRHTMATHYLDDPEAREGDLQTIAGWNSPAMLKRYTKQGITRRAIAAHRRLSPVARLGA